MITLQLASKPTFSWDGETDLGRTRVKAEYTLDGDFDVSVTVVDEEKTDRYRATMGLPIRSIDQMPDNEIWWIEPRDATDWRLAFEGFLKAQFDAASEVRA